VESESQQLLFAPEPEEEEEEEGETLSSKELSPDAFVALQEPDTEVRTAMSDLVVDLQGGNADETELSVLESRVSDIMRSLGNLRSLPVPLQPLLVEEESEAVEAEEAQSELEDEQAEPDLDTSLESKVEHIMDQLRRGLRTELPAPFSPIPTTPPPSRPPPLSPIPVFEPEPEPVPMPGLELSLPEKGPLPAITRRVSQYEFEDHTVVLQRALGYNYKSAMLYVLAQAGEHGSNWLDAYFQELHALLYGSPPYLDTEAEGARWLNSEKNMPHKYRPTKAEGQLKALRRLKGRILAGQERDFPEGTPKMFKKLSEIADAEFEHRRPQIDELYAHLTSHARVIATTLQSVRTDLATGEDTDVSEPPVRWVHFEDGTTGLEVRHRNLLQPIFFPHSTAKDPNTNWALMSDTVNGQGWVMGVSKFVAEDPSIAAALRKHRSKTKRKRGELTFAVSEVPQTWVLVQQQQAFFQPNQPTSIFLWNTLFGQSRTQKTPTRRAHVISDVLTAEQQLHLLNPSLSRKKRRGNNTVLQPRTATSASVPVISEKVNVTQEALRDIRRAQRDSKIIPQPAWQGPNTNPTAAHPGDRFESLSKTWWRLTSPRPQSVAVKNARVIRSEEGGVLFYGPVPVTEAGLLSLLNSVVLQAENEAQGGMRLVGIEREVIEAGPEESGWQRVEQSLITRCTAIYWLECFTPPRFTDEAELEEAIKRGEAGDAELNAEFRSHISNCEFVFSSADTDFSRQFVRGISEMDSPMIQAKKDIPMPDRYLGTIFLRREYGKGDMKAGSKKLQVLKTGFGIRTAALIQLAPNLFPILRLLLRVARKEVRLTHDFFRPRNLQGEIDREKKQRGFNTNRWLPVLLQRQYFIPTWGLVIPVRSAETNEIVDYTEFDWSLEEEQFLPESVYVAHSGHVLKGYSLYASMRIERGQRVIRYTGMALDEEQEEESYPGAMLAPYVLGSGSEGAVDAQRFGNEARFANAEDSHANRIGSLVYSALLHAKREKIPDPVRIAKELPQALYLFSYRRRSADPHEEVTFYYGNSYVMVESIPRINQRSYFLGPNGSLQLINTEDRALAREKK
jgi:hypothetical protein